MTGSCTEVSETEAFIVKPRTRRVDTRPSLPEAVPFDIDDILNGVEIAVPPSPPSPTSGIPLVTPRPAPSVESVQPDKAVIENILRIRGAIGDLAECSIVRPQMLLGRSLKVMMDELALNIDNLALMALEMPTQAESQKWSARVSNYQYERGLYVRAS